MEKSVNSGLSELESRLLGVLVRYGPEGRAITVESLAATAGLDLQSPEFMPALENLVTRGFIKPAGADPIPGSPLAFRITRRITREDVIDPDLGRIGILNTRKHLAAKENANSRP
jgi:hypothetical protein